MNIKILMLDVENEGKSLAHKKSPIHQLADGT